MAMLIDITPGDAIPTGAIPETVNEEIPVWSELNNVYIKDGGLSRYLGAERIGTVTEDISHIVQLYTIAGQRQAVFAGDTGTWHFDGTTITLINQPFTAGGTPVLETWGNWVLGTNNVDVPQVWKGTGVFGPLAGVNFSKVLQFIRRQPFMLALNTSLGGNVVQWSSDSDVETWGQLPTNRAGDFTIRDLNGEIRGGAPLGDNIAIYSQEALAIASYIGLPYVFSVNVTLRGIGVFGPKAIASVGRQNYGLGLQGPFVTDGFSFQLLGDDQLREWITANLDQERWDEVIVFHNEVIDCIEFRFPLIDGSYYGLVFKSKRNRFTQVDLPLSAAVEREVFSTPLVGIGNALCWLNRTQLWDQQLFDGRAKTKWLDAGTIEFNKFFEVIQLDGLLDNMNLTIEVQDENGIDEILLQETDVEKRNFIFREALKIRLTVNGEDDWHLSHLRVFGGPAGAVM